MEQFLEEINKAKEYVNNSDYRCAVSWYRKALNNIPSNLCPKRKKILHEEFADLLNMQQELAEAEDNYEKCISESKDAANFEEVDCMRYLKLGITVARQGRFVDAKAIYLEVLDKMRASHTDSSLDFEINKNVAFIYNNLAELACHLAEGKEERRYRSIAKNVEHTLNTIEKATKENKSEYVIRRYVKPCAEEVERKFQKEGVYKTSTGTRGFCIIINNKEFTNGSTRNGSEVDVANLENVFTQLSFEVKVEKDISAEKLPKIVNSWVNSSKNDVYHAFVLVVMSHGTNKNEILDKDDKPVVLHEALRELYVSPRLRGKPKLVIVQACRGNDSNDVGPENSTPPSFCGQIASHKENIGCIYTATENMDAKKSDACSTKDCCIMNATCYGFVAYRDPNQGSPFIAAVTEALFLYSHEKHMKNILEEVKKIMEKKNYPQEPGLEEWFKGKEFYFFPAFDGDED